MPQAVAQRYARALSDVVAAQGDYAATLREIDAFASIYRESAELREVFDSPAVKPEQKLGVLNAILERLGTSRIVANFLRVLERNYRLNLIEEVMAAFRDAASDRLGIAQMKVFSAEALNEEEKAALEGRFGGLTGKKLETTFGVDAALVGGIVAQIKSTIYDGSVRGALDEIQKQMAAAL